MSRIEFALLCHENMVNSWFKIISIMAVYSVHYICRTDVWDLSTFKLNISHERKHLCFVVFGAGSGVGRWNADVHCIRIFELVADPHHQRVHRLWCGLQGQILCVAMLATVLEQSVVVGALRLDNECFAVGAVYQLHGLRRRPSVE